MKDMSSVYYGMKDKQIRTLRSQKISAILRLERKHLGYFEQQELKKLRHQLKQIEAVLEARRLQMTLE